MLGNNRRVRLMLHPLSKCRLMHSVIMPLANHKFTVCSLFDDSACVHDDYEIGVFENVETLGRWLCQQSILSTSPEKGMQRWVWGLGVVCLHGSRESVSVPFVYSETCR